MKKTWIFVLSLSLSILGFTPLALAQQAEPEDTIKYRKSIMTAIKGHNSAIKSIVTGKVPHTQRITYHLTSLKHLFDEIEILFPEGSDFGKTNAKDAVWENPDKFTKAISNSRQALNNFQGIAAKGDLKKTAAAFKKFGKSSCGGCHKSFKKKKK